jgi:hypothetical protein
MLHKMTWTPVVIPSVTAMESAAYPRKKWINGVSGRICLYVACYDFVLGFNVSSSPLMFFQVGFWGVILMLK